MMSLSASFRAHALRDALAELVRLGAHLRVGEFFHLRLARVDLLHDGEQPLHFALVAGSKYLG